MRINHNIGALNAWRNLSKTNRDLDKSLERLSSGLRINRAADDAAGLAISEKMRAQTRGLNAASRNAQDAISLIQTGEGALEESHAILQRMRELSVQASSDSLTDDDRAQIQKEVDGLAQELDRIGNDTEFNTKKLLDGSAGVSVSSSASSEISNTSADGSTVAGVYSIDAYTVATATTRSTDFTTALGAGNEPGAVTDSLSNASALTVNGKTYNFTTSNTYQDVVDAVNADSNTTGVEASWSGGELKFDATKVGSAYDVDLSGSGDFANFGAKTAGADATVTLDAASAKTWTSYKAVGNQISVVDGDGAGLSFEIAAASDHAAGGTDVALTVGTNGSLSFQIGANAGQTMALSIGDVRASALGIADVNLATKAGAQSALSALDSAINTVSGQRADLGAIQNRLEHTINSLGSAEENLTAAESRVRDVDMAKEMTSFTRSQILAQSGTAMLAQANARPQSVLQLLG